VQTVALAEVRDGRRNGALVLVGVFGVVLHDVWLYLFLLFVV
jgi:hypothetical protein